MASGTITFTASGSLQGKIDWASTAGSSTNNNSVVTAILYGRRTDNYTTKGQSWTGGVYINSGSGNIGTAINFSSAVTIGNSWVEMARTVQTITHLDNGEKSITISGSVKGPSGTALSGNTSSGSQVVNLDTIPRYFSRTPSVAVPSKSSTSVTINWATSEPCMQVVYNINGGNWVTVAYDINTTSGSFTISNLNPGTTYTINTDFRRRDSGLWALTKPSFNVTTYYKTIPTISLYNKTSSSITVTPSCNVSVSQTLYRIKTSTGDFGNFQASNSFTGLAANTSYVVQVYMVGKDSGESGTASLSVTTYNKTIPTIALVSKTINSITVSSGCNVSVSETKYRIRTASTSYGNYQTSPTFMGLAANTSFIIEVYKVGTESKESGIATITISTYPEAVLVNCPDFNLGNSAAITYSNPSGSPIMASIFPSGDMYHPLVEYRTVSGSNYVFTFTDAELDNLYKKMGTANSLRITFWLSTECNNVRYLNSKDATIILNGNKKTGHVNISGNWRRTQKWVNVNGTWKRCVRWVNVNGTWKRCI